MSMTYAFLMTFDLPFIVLQFQIDLPEIAKDCQRLPEIARDCIYRAAEFPCASLGHLIAKVALTTKTILPTNRNIFFRSEKFFLIYLTLNSAAAIH